MTGGGAAAADLPAAHQHLPGPGSEFFCTDLYRDPGNCGACGNACAAGSYCRERPLRGGHAAAAHLLPAAGDLQGPDGQDYCTDTFHDPGNCGACGEVCPRTATAGTAAARPARRRPPSAGSRRAACRDRARSCSAPTPTGIPTTAAAAARSARWGPTARRASARTARRRRPPARPPLKICIDPRGGTFCTDPLSDPGTAAAAASPAARATTAAKASVRPAARRPAATRP